ncbi:MAG: hypothetical protein ACYDEN_13535, partial [Acidimicrobiales bacterium]
CFAEREQVGPHVELGGVTDQALELLESVLEECFSPSGSMPNISSRATRESALSFAMPCYAAAVQVDSGVAADGRRREG